MILDRLEKEKDAADIAGVHGSIVGVTESVWVSDNF